MVADPELIAEWAKIRDDPREFVKRLVVEDERNKLRNLSPLWPEQEMWVTALLSGRWCLGLKPRQVGFTTITCAVMHHKVITTPHAERCLQMVHERSAKSRLARMGRTFIRHLPPEIRPQYGANSEDQTDYKGSGAGFNRLLAGGSGQARSWTYNHLHATEMSKWRSRTASNTNEEGHGTDAETFSSAMNTIHDPNALVVVESTGNGPYGLFYDLYRQALVDPKWAFVFVPWSAVARYRDTLTPEQARDLEQELDTDERKLMAEFDLDLGQIAWRRGKIASLGGSVLTFRREFPLTDDEPFKLDEHGWFDQDGLSLQLKYCEILGADTDPMRVFSPWESGHAYVICVDTAGGVGADEAAIHVIRDDLVHCLRWASNQASPAEQAQMVARISQLYRRPVVIIEANKYGKDVIEKCEAMGCRMWTTPEGGWWWSEGGRAGNSKRDMYVHAREVIDGGYTVMRDATTIRQAQKVVEKSNGKIEGSGSEHDDRIDAYALGLWAAKDLWGPAPDTIGREKDRIKVILNRYGRSDGSYR